MYELMFEFLINTRKITCQDTAAYIHYFFILDNASLPNPTVLDNFCAFSFKTSHIRTPLLAVSHLELKMGIERL